MSEGDQQDDAPEEARDQAQMPTTASAGMAQEAVRSRRGQGRRVVLARQRSGGYSIWVMRRHIQGFCNEWEDITNFQLPEGFEQQVRINIEPAGEAREIRSLYSGEEQDSRAEVAREDPNPPVGADLLNMFRELPRHNREIIERQIRANHRDEFGAGLISRAHPLQALREESIERMEIDIPAEENDVLRALHAELVRIGSAVENLRR